ncbi:hypothetical protein LZ554_004467 [Drepanopeziza brunnea f. sp. 'monogermtubi']|nr:hypothetical protein LZ554_004467 [Drepanopeziza brunnea f. sp. 'monogermtubi']
MISRSPDLPTSRPPDLPIPTDRRSFITLARSKSTLALVLSSAQHSPTLTPVTPPPDRPSTTYRADLEARHIPTTRTTIPSAAFNRIDG